MTRKADPRTARSLVQAGELPQFTPVPRQRGRHDGWTSERQRQFIEALADTGSVDAACRAVDMSQPGVYLLRRQPGAESFRAAWEQALDLGVQRIEDVAMDRALNGVEVPVYSYGKLVGTRRTYNDGLLMFMLRNRAPGRFAAGQTKGLNAVDQMKLDRIKKQLRAEWEAEQRRVSPAEVRASIDRKVEALRLQLEAQRQREWEQLSEETRAAWDRFVALKERDLAALEPARPEPVATPARPEPVATPAHPEPVEGERNNAEITLPPPGWRKRKPVAAPEEENPRWRTLKDEGW